MEGDEDSKGDEYISGEQSFHEIIVRILIERFLAVCE